MKKKLVLIWIFCSFQLLNAQFEIKTTTIDQKSIFDYASIYNAKLQEKSIEEIIELPKSEFKKLQNENQDLGFTNDNYWLTFTLKNKTQKPVNYFLETARPIIDNAEFYTIQNDKLLNFQKSGDAIPFSTRSFQHRKTIFRIQLKPNEQLTYYLHLRSDGEAINVPLMLRSDENLIQNTSFEQIIFGFFYGILVIAAILYLFFFFSMKEKVFLYYSLYVVFIGLLQFSLDGYFYEYLLPNSNWLSKKSVLIFAIFSAIFLGNYAQNFLNIKRTDSIFNQFYYVLYALLFLLFLAICFLPNYYAYCYPIMNFIGLILLLLIIFSLIKVYITTKRIFFFFSIGLFFLIVGFVVFILKNFSLLPYNFITENSTKLGTGLEIIFYSLSMANLIGELKEDKIKSQTIALKKSEEMNELKSHFLSNISHELRTPLNTILNVSQIISTEKDLNSINEKCQLIKYSSQNLLSAVNDILDFSKIENNEFSLENKAFDFTGLVNDIAKNYQIKAAEKGLQFQFVLNDKIPKILLGDKNRLYQMLSNVVQNAVKFTEKGTVQFIINYSEIRSDSVTLTIRVSDTGIGIKKEKLDTIFDSFSQELIDDKRKYGGLGLGLFIVNNIVEKYNGKIKFESEVDKGSHCEIEIKLPILEDSNNHFFQEIEFNLKEKNILIVEDNIMNQMVLKMILKSWENTKYDMANNGQEALDLLQKTNFDIILMDLQMPVMDGYEATIAIRSGACGIANKTIPIIAITADTTEATKARVFEIGMDYYMTKPIDKLFLFTKIHEFTNKNTM